MTLFLLLLLIFLSQFSYGLISNSRSAGFRLSLFHRDSMHSPLYHDNLTSSELHFRLLNYSQSRLLWLKSFPKTTPKSINSAVNHTERWQYIVKVSIGTPSISQNLLMCTASDLIWTQCHPHTHGFPQDSPHFFPSHSRTISDIPSNTIICRKMRFGHVGKKCLHEVFYNDGSYTHGLLKRDVFTFVSQNGTSEHFPLAFGCSTDTAKTIFNTERSIAGILAMGLQVASLPRQLGHVGEKFSYCLLPIDSPIVSYLDFGDSVPSRPHTQNTSLHSYSNMPSGYYVDLIDLSFNNRRLYLPRGTFAAKPSEKRGGCTIDTGSQYSFIVEPSYQALINRMSEYFAHLGLKEVKEPDYPSFHCYAMPREFDKFPNVTLHFAGVDLLLTRSRLWAVETERGFFCLGLLIDDSVTIIGAMQQTGVRFIYDLKRRIVTMGEENCANDNEKII